MMFRRPFAAEEHAPLSMSRPGIAAVAPAPISPPRSKRWASASPQVRERIGRVIFGQREVIDQALITLLAGGHALLIGVPGLAKTRLVETLGTVLGLEDKRIQCTPDLMPADILGSEVLEESDDRPRARSASSRARCSASC